MPRWLFTMVLVGIGSVVGMGSATGQSTLTLSTLRVQLWPEYDQPSMLVIYDFEVAPGTALPASVPIRIPKQANLMAVAMQGADGSLVIADYVESGADESWQTVAVKVDSLTTYRIEYYQPLQRDGETRSFDLEWPGDLGVQSLAVSARIPADATQAQAEPQLLTARTDELAAYHEGAFGPIGIGEGLKIHLSYARSSEVLTAPEQGLQPSQQLDGNTPGRVILSNYLPYFLGVLGAILIGGGAFYFWQTSRRRTPRERRHRPGVGPNNRRTEEIYCHECGTRAQPGDRFCRVCGTRLRPPE
jgi:zinc ribbon protein